MRKRVERWMVVLPVLAAFGTGGCGDEEDLPGAYIEAGDQVVEARDVVVVDEVSLPAAGWVVVHEEAEDEIAGDAIGYAQADQGVTFGVTVTLGRDVLDGEMLIAALHRDEGQKGTFEYPGADDYLLDEGIPVIDPFEVSLPAPGPDVDLADPPVGQVSTVLLVEEAASDGPGWVVVRESDSEEPAGIIGHAQVQDGLNQGIEVVLDRPLLDGEIIHAELYADQGAVGVFEVPGDDPPVLGTDDTPVAESRLLEVPAGTPAVILDVVNITDQAFDFRSVDPDAYGTIIGNEENNQTLALKEGWRYRIVNPVTATHPLELIEAGVQPEDDQVLLSQQAEGSLEDDLDIAWEEDVEAVGFNLTAELAVVLQGYRCAAHPEQMRGTIEVVSD